MSIEIRELVIRSEVVERNAQIPDVAVLQEASDAALQRIKAEVLASCRELLERRLSNQRER